MPQPSSRSKPAVFQTTLPLTGPTLTLSFFLSGTWSTAATMLKVAMISSTETTMMTATPSPGLLPVRWLAREGAGGGGVLAARGVLGGGAGGLAAGGFGAAAGVPAGTFGARDLS